VTDGVGGAYGDEAVIRRLLTETEVWAVVGLADNPARPAWGVARRLQSHGKRIIPVHPRAETVHGEQGYATLAEIPVPVDVVDLFVNSTRVGELMDAAIAIGAPAVWTQLDVVDDAAAARAAAAGLDVVMDRCPAIEGPRLGLW
jgi:predicted CoA-binding protein